MLIQAAGLEPRAETNIPQDDASKDINTAPADTSEDDAPRDVVGMTSKDTTREDPPNTPKIAATESWATQLRPCMRKLCVDVQVMRTLPQEEASVTAMETGTP